jgi:peptidoglycan/LPS O-acetylase OafA/YrhL
MLQVFDPRQRHSGIIGDICTIFSFGHYAVTMFIILSGFCLMLGPIKSAPEYKIDGWKFLIKRAKRILPTYYFALLFSLILIWLVIGHKTGTHWDIALPVTKGTVIIHLLLLQNFFASSVNKINHVMWSISLEWWIYFLFPGLVLLWRKVGPTKATATAVLLSFLLVGMSRITKEYWGLQYVACFALGAFAAGVAYDGNSEFAKIKALPWGAIAAVIFCSWLMFACKHLVSLTTSDLLFAAFSMSLLLYASKPLPNPASSFFGAKPFAWLGSISYSLYLIHAPLLQLFQQVLLMPYHVTPVTTFVILAVVTVPLIIAFTYGFHFLFERPFMNTKPNQETVLARN